MDETRVRTIIREEIILAMKTLGRVAGSNAAAMSEDRASEADGGYAIESAAGTFFESAYEADCVAADKQRAEDAANPFEETASDGTDIQTVIRTEVARALESLSASARYRDMPYETGEIESTALQAIAESADGAISEYAARCETADEEQAETPDGPWPGSVI